MTMGSFGGFAFQSHREIPIERVWMCDNLYSTPFLDLDEEDDFHYKIGLPEELNLPERPFLQDSPARNLLQTGGNKAIGTKKVIHNWK